MDFLTRIPESTRHTIYSVGLAVIALAGIYGMVSDVQAIGWVAVVTALFNGTMAVANTRSKPPVDEV